MIKKVMLLFLVGIIFVSGCSHDRDDVGEGVVDEEQVEIERGVVDDSIDLGVFEEFRGVEDCGVMCSVNEECFILCDNLDVVERAVDESNLALCDIFPDGLINNCKDPVYLKLAKSDSGFCENIVDDDLRSKCFER